MTYTVRTGDTLSELAIRYRCKQDEILALNPQIENRHRIFVGMKIRIPAGK